MPITDIKLNEYIRAFTYGKTGVMYQYNVGSLASKKKAYNKIIKYVKAIHANKMIRKSDMHPKFR